MQDHYQEEISAKENLGRSLNKALGEADMLRVRYEKEGVAKAEELEMAKLKMQVNESRIPQFKKDKYTPSILSRPVCPRLILPPTS